MQLLRWNNVKPIPRARHQTSVFHGQRDWKPRKSSSPPVEGELFPLTFPFIDQALAEDCAACSPQTRSMRAMDLSTVDSPVCDTSQQKKQRKPFIVQF